MISMVIRIEVLRWFDDEWLKVFVTTVKQYLYIRLNTAVAVQEKRKQKV